MSRIINITVLLLCVVTAMAAPLRPADVRNVQVENRNCYVSDMCNVLTAEERSALDAKCAALRNDVGVELAIVIVDEIEGDDEYTFAYELFNLWHIGDKRNNSGVLWLYVKSLRAMKIETGVGIEGVLPDGFLKRVLEDNVFPLMKEDMTYRAFDTGLTMIVERVTSDEAREELVMQEVGKRTFWADFICCYFIIAFIVMMILAIFFYVNWQTLKGPNNERYTQLSGISAFTVIAAFVFPVPVLFLYLKIRKSRRSLRYMPMVCPKCGARMKVLSEKEEDAYLNATQQAEENVHTIDYDVWLCPDCGATSILKYQAYASTLYKKCPQCGGHTYKKVAEKIVVPPTPLTAGRGERVFRCAACGCVHRTQFTIPPVPVVIGGGRGSGGGSFGGGFGGGFSGGGGAGGRF